MQDELEVLTWGAALKTLNALVSQAEQGPGEREGCVAPFVGAIALPRVDALAGRAALSAELALCRRAQGASQRSFWLSRQGISLAEGDMSPRSQQRCGSLLGIARKRPAAPVFDFGELTESVRIVLKQSLLMAGKRLRSL